MLDATISYFALRGAPEVYLMALSAFTAGILISVAVEEMVSQAHEALTEENQEESGWATIAPVGGFALFALLTVYLEVAG
jgi:zinc transporter, ZIP family